MKLRLRGDSLRLRLTRTEVTTLRDRGWWQDSTCLIAGGSGTLAYRVEITEANVPAVRFETGTSTVIAVTLPAADVVSWANGVKVGLYFDEPWGLKVAVEKDFQCLDPRRDEDESDNFDNPNMGTGHSGECQVG